MVLPPSLFPFPSQSSSPIALLSSLDSADSSVPWTSPLHFHLTPPLPLTLISDSGSPADCLTKLSLSLSLSQLHSGLARFPDFPGPVPLLAPVSRRDPYCQPPFWTTHSLQHFPPTSVLSGYILLANLPSELVGVLQLFTFPLVLDLSVHCSSFVAFSPVLATVVAAYHHSYLPWSSSPRSPLSAPGLDRILGPVVPGASLRFGAALLTYFRSCASGLLWHRGWSFKIPSILLPFLRHNHPLLPLNSYFSFSPSSLLNINSDLPCNRFCSAFGLV